MPERIITLAGHPLSPVLGAPVRVGDPAPAAAGRTNVFGVDSFDVLADTAGKVRVLNFVPAIDMHPDYQAALAAVESLL